MPKRGVLHKKNIKPTGLVSCLFFKLFICLFAKSIMTASFKSRESSSDIVIGFNPPTGTSLVCDIIALTSLLSS
jgi:hypothetical protein